MSMRTEHDIKLMLYAQSALLGEVAPSFRAVSFELSSDGVRALYSMVSQVMMLKKLPVLH